MARKILIHLNVEVPESDKRDVKEISEEIDTSLLIGQNSAPNPVKIIVALFEEI